jgi:hypothetical protein
MTRSRNVDSFSNRALGTKLGSANSMYANLDRLASGPKKSDGGAIVPFRMACDFITENGDSKDGSARREMGLNFLWGSSVVDVSDKDTSSIDVLPFVLR